MRIVSGRLGGRRLPPAGKNVRPTSERVREALMSMIGDEIVGARVLDVFAGSGAFGFEALSRGAHSATFVERDVRTARQIEATAVAFGVASDVKVVLGSVPGVLSRLTPDFDLLFFDPPYEVAEPAELLTAARGLAAPTACVILETASRLVPPVEGAGFVQGSTRTYGEARITIYRR